MVLLLSLAPTASTGAEERLYNRLQVCTISEQPQTLAGASDVYIKFTEDLLEPCEMYLKFLRQSLLPEHAGIRPARIFLGRERYAIVTRLSSSECLANGRRGTVREGFLGSRRVVVKRRPIYGPDSHHFSVQMEKFKQGISARFGTLANISHPNILRYVGFFIEHTGTSPPCIGIVQEHCESNLSILLAQHHGHDPDIDLDNSEVAQLFKELDVNGDGKVSCLQTCCLIFSEFDVLEVRNDVL